MGVKWNPMGLIAYCTQFLIDPPGATVTTATLIGGAIYEIIENFENDKKESPYNLYIKTFEKVVRESLNESFGIADNEENIISDLAEIKLSDCQISHPECKNYLNQAIFNILNGYDVFTDNISNNTIDKFIDSINIKMKQKTLDDSVLQSFVTYELTNKIYEIELDTNRIVNSTDIKVDGLYKKIDNMQADLDYLKSGIVNKASNSESSSLESKLFATIHENSVIVQGSGDAISEIKPDIDNYLDDNIENIASVVQYRMSVSSDRGSLFLYSHESTSKENAKKYTVQEREWAEITNIIAEYVAYLYHTEPELVVITLYDKLTDKKCAPLDGYSYYDEQFRINFGVSYITSNYSMVYDSAHIDVSNTLSLKFFKKGDYIFHDFSADLTLEDIGLDETICVGLSEKLLHVLYPNRKIITSSNFELKVYSDCSGGYKLRYLVK